MSYEYEYLRDRYWDEIQQRADRLQEAYEAERMAYDRYWDQRADEYYEELFREEMSLKMFDLPEEVVDDEPF